MLKRFIGYQKSGMIFAILLICLVVVCAPIFAPYDPFDAKQVSLWDGKLPPFWLEGGQWRYILGTDDQGRDLLSMILYGGRLSIMIGFFALMLAVLIGVTLGLIAGYFKGVFDVMIMRLADIQLTFPGVLMAILFNGIGRVFVPIDIRDELAIYIIIVAIGLSEWPQFARVVRGLVLVDMQKEYVQAARILKLPNWLILWRHILPNILRPVLVLMPFGFVMAILQEATLSFLGQGLAPTEPSLGTLIHVGYEFLFSGLWWIVLFPSVVLICLIFSINMIGDQLREGLHPNSSYLGGR